MADAAHAPSASEYIVHHLTHFNTSGHPQEKVIDFSLVNLDTVFWAVLMGLVSCFLMYRAARSVTSGVPGRFVGAIESVVEFVHEQARSIVKGDITYIAPLALVSFVWIFFMNAMDFIPLDLIPKIWEQIHGAAGGDPHHAYMRVVPTADLNATLAMSLVVLGASATWWGASLHILTGLGWAIFHILIVALQAFIFMMLTLVYIGQAHEHH